MDILFSRLRAEMPDYVFSPQEQDFWVSDVQLYSANGPWVSGTLYLADGAQENNCKVSHCHILAFGAPEQEGLLSAAGPGSFGQFVNAVLGVYHQLISSPDRITERVSVLARCKSIQQHLDVVYELIQAPVLLADGNFSIIGECAPKDYDDPLWLSMRKLKEIPVNLITSSAWRNAEHRMIDTALPCTVAVPGTDTTLAMYLILDGDTYLGLIVASLPDGSLSTFQGEILAVLGRLISGNLKSRSDYYMQRQNALDHFFSFMLQGRSYPDTVLQRWLDSTPWTPRRFKRIYVFHAADYIADGAYFGFSSILQDIPKYAGDHALVFYSDVVLFQSRAEPMRADSEPVNSILHFGQAHGLVVGVSREFTDLRDIHRHYNQARDALGIGVQFHPNEAVYWYEDYADFRLLQAAAQQLDLGDICHPGIRTLYEADRNNGSAFLQTLRNYLNHGRSIAATAGDMHIHRNTVTYRVEHCLRICGLNLDNAHNLLHMLLSLLILDYQESQSENDHPRDTASPS
jgi:hypothetical protein